MPARYTSLLRDFADRAGRVLDDAALRIDIEDVARELGFELFAVLHLPSLTRRSPHFIRYDNYPDGWSQRVLSVQSQPVFRGRS